ncbi:MAG: tRNA (adenosine(37)-N6)-threonylcarbamoyltransferase complex transferase subunit TsaD [Candidatus Falkowbacteria bacterium]
MIILGIETSCDETAAAVVEKTLSGNFVVRSNIISSQTKLHAEYGGVVPELAAREHLQNILPVITQALRDAKISDVKKISAIAVSQGPGLITSLMSGLETAKTLAYAWQLPLIPINHIESHLYANFIEQPKIKLPALVLTVSGGHTTLLLLNKHGDLTLLGETLDDAAGEAFDKAAQLMNLGYPGGPIVSAWANKFKNDTHLIHLPRPMLNKPGYNFSFSGLKTALLYQLQNDSSWRKNIPEYCAEFQQAIVDVLVGKAIKAAKTHPIKSILLAGGVAANTCLRETLDKNINKQWPLYLPPLKYTTDNAAMVATAGFYHWRDRLKGAKVLDITANANLALFKS